MSVGHQNGNETNRPSTGGAGQGPADWDGVREDLTGAAGDLAGAATARGRQFIDAARDQAAEYVDRRKDSAAQSVADVANSLRESGGAFEDRPNIKVFVDNAADGLDQLADTIRERTFADLYDDIEEFARRRPTAFAGAATVVGFMLARFLKSSAENAEIRRQDARRRSAAPMGARHAGSQAGSHAGSASGSHAGSQPGSHAGSKPGSQPGSQAGSPAAAGAPRGGSAPRT